MPLAKSVDAGIFLAIRFKASKTMNVGSYYSQSPNDPIEAAGLHLTKKEG